MPFSTDIQDFLALHASDSVSTLALQRSRFRQFTDTEWTWLLQQLDGRQRMRDKLPELADNPKIEYPPHLNLEQCSSQATALYKNSLLKNLPVHTLIDLTGGFGIDTIYMSRTMTKAYYVEQNESLCHIAQHNFQLLHQSILTYAMDAKAFLLAPPKVDTKQTAIFIDPARRSNTGSKVFRLSDCEPNVLTLIPQILAIADTVLIKCSPMLDISLALSELQHAASSLPSSSLLPTSYHPSALESSPRAFSIHVVSVRNEVKEILFLTSTHATLPHGHISVIDLTPPSPLTNLGQEAKNEITTNNCSTPSDTAYPTPFTFTLDEEHHAVAQYISCPKEEIGFLYEPSAGLLKAGAYQLISQRWGIKKLAPSTHLYASRERIPNFPGRTFQVLSMPICKKGHYNILTRNYPLTPEQIRQKYRLIDGGDLYLIGARIISAPTSTASSPNTTPSRAMSTTPILFVAQRLS